MYIEDSYLEEIKNRLDLVAVISEYVDLKPAGRSFKGLCPFHEEKTPSFVVTPEKGIFHCFGCGTGGNIFSFLVRIENITFPEAVELLAEKCGVDLPRRKKGSDLRQKKDKERFFELVEATRDYYLRELIQSREASAVRVRKYLLEKRAIKPEIIQEFGIGFSPPGGKGSIEYLLAKGFSGQEIIASGVGNITSRRILNDRFRGRVTFTLQDVNGRIIGFAGRAMDDYGPKYLNVPEGKYFSKGKHLYGLHASKTYIRKDGRAILVEGYMDFLALYQAGIQCVVASMGTALTREQAALLRRFTEEVIICFDSDSAGEAATARGMSLLNEKGLQVRILALPSPYDPDSYLQERGKKGFEKILQDAKPLFDYQLGLLIKKFGSDTLESKVKIVHGIEPFVLSIDDPVERSLRIKQVSQKLCVSESVFYESVGKKGEHSPAVNLLKRGHSLEPGNIKAERLLLQVAVDNAVLREYILREMKSEDWSVDENQRFFQAVCTLSEKKNVFTAADLIDVFSGDEKMGTYVSRVCSSPEAVSCDAEVVRSLVGRVRLAALEKAKQRLQKELSTRKDIEVLRRFKLILQQEKELRQQHKERGEGVL